MATPFARLSRNDMLRIVEIRTKIVSAASLAIGAAWAAVHAPHFSIGVLLLMVMASLLVDLGTTAFNSYFDYTGGVDTRESDLTGDKVLLEGRVDPKAALWIGALCYLAAMPLGLLLGWLVHPAVIWIGAGCMLVGFGYSGGPLALSRTPWGELFAGGTLGFVLILLTAWVLGAPIGAPLVLLALAPSLLIAAILSTNNACDLQGDARAGRRTLAIVLGPVLASRLVEVLVGAGLAIGLMLPLTAVLPAGFLLAWLAVLALAVYTLRAMRARGYSAASKAPNMGGISLIFLAASLALVGALLWQAWA